MTGNIVGTSRAMEWKEGANAGRLSAILGIAVGAILAVAANLVLP